MAIQRLTGLVSGMDIDTLVKNLMKAESAKVDKLKQKRQTYQWQQETFQDINTSLLSLKTQSFNMKLSSTYKTFNASTSDSAVVNATGTSAASEGTYKVVVKQLATVSEKKSVAMVGSTADISNFDFSGKDFNLTFNGVQHNISWGAAEGSYSNIDELVAGLQSKINDAVGSNNIVVSSSENKIVLTPAGTNAIQLNTGTTVDALAQLNVSNNAQSHTNLSPLLQSTSDITAFDFSNKNFNITFDGTQKNISWGSEGNYSNIDQLVVGLQDKIDNAFGSNQITVSKSGNQIILNPTDTTFKPNILLTSGTTNDALAQLNFDNNSESHISLDTQLKDLKFSNGTLTFDPADDKLKFTINGSSFAISETDTLQTLMTTVNGDANADVTMSYDSSKDVISIKRKSTGAGKDITFSNGTNSNFSTIVGLGATVEGKNSIIDFTDNNGVLTENVERASNSVTLDGINMTLLKEDPLSEKTITITQNVDAVYDKIKAFIDTYNTTLDKLNTKLSEKKEYAYAPLTDEQKSAMKDSDITNWETKAKSGLVSGDSTLQGIVRDLRNSVVNEIPGLNQNFNQLSEFGITTGGYTEQGKLYIDETKLKQAIAENPDEVVSFFTNNPQDLKGSAISGVVDVDNKDFQITLNGAVQTVTLSGTYDLSTSDGKTNFIKELNDKISSSIGYNQITATLSSDNKVILDSPAGYSFTLNSGTTNDALSSIGLTNGASFDASQKGVISKVYDKLNIAIKTITNKAGSTSQYYDTSLIGKEITNINTDITNENERLTEIENRYYDQFTKMETYISQMNSQSNWLSQQLGTSSSS